MVLSENIKEILNKKNMSMYKLAKESDVSISYIWEIVQGRKKNPSIATIKKIALVLGTTVDELIGWEGNDE